jgi:hypothetical protein
VGAYGIAVLSGGPDSPATLQHVVIEGNTVSGTRTGQSETITVNGDVTDFLVAKNTVTDADNIGIAAIGWELDHGQANHGLITDNLVSDVDTYSNDAYGTWKNGACHPLPENAAGIYTDGAAYIWISANVVWNSDQGINLDVEIAHETTSHLLVSGNTVVNTEGTSSGDPSAGPEPSGVSGTSDVAGHDPYAFYVDAVGTGSTIRDVYAHDNTFENQSQHFLHVSWGMPVVAFGGNWGHVMLWHNTIEGGLAGDRYNPLEEIDTLPHATAVLDCEVFVHLTNASTSVDGNFALPTSSYLSLTAWQSHNGHGWDTHSVASGSTFSSACPPSAD